MPGFEDLLAAAAGVAGDGVLVYLGEQVAGVAGD